MLTKQRIKDEEAKRTKKTIDGDEDPEIVAKDLIANAGLATITFVLFGTKRFRIPVTTSLIEYSSLCKQILNKRKKQMRKEPQKAAATATATTDGKDFELAIDTKLYPTEFTSGFILVLGWLKFCEQLTEPQKAYLIVLLQQIETFIEQMEVSKTWKANIESTTGRSTKIIDLHLLTRSYQRTLREMKDFYYLILDILEKWGLRWNLDQYSQVEKAASYLRVKKLQKFLLVGAVPEAHFTDLESFLLLILEPPNMKSGSNSSSFIQLPLPT